MVNNNRQPLQPQDEATYTIACPICQAIYTPLPSHTYLLQSSKMALESAFISMCHFCFRCRRPSCPSCWDEVHGLCGTCGFEAGLPFRSIGDPLPGILFPPTRSIQIHPTRPIAARLLCITPGIFQSDIVPSERVTTIPIHALKQQHSRLKSSAQKQTQVRPHSASPLEPDLTELITRPERSSVSAHEELPTRPECPPLPESQEIPTRSKATLPTVKKVATPSQIERRTPTPKVQRPIRSIRHTPTYSRESTVRTGRRIHSESAARQQTRPPQTNKEKLVANSEPVRPLTTKKLVSVSIPQLLLDDQPDASIEIPVLTSSNLIQNRVEPTQPKSPQHRLEIIFTTLSLSIFSIVFLLIIAALTSQNANIMINNLLHIDIRDELSYLWHLIKLIHF